MGTSFDAHVRLKSSILFRIELTRIVMRLIYNHNYNYNK